MNNDKNLTIEKTFNLAIQNHQGGKFDIACDLYQKVLEIDRNYVKAHYNLGVVYKVLKEYPKAIICFKKSIEINPKYIDAHNNLGIIFKQLGRFQEARSCYESVIKIDPNYEKAYNNLGNLFYTLGDNKRAIYYYQKFISLKPDNETLLYNLGITLHSDKEYKKAIEQFKLTNFANSKSFLLSCLYELNDKYTFINELDNQIKQGANNAIIGSLISRSEIKYGIKRLNPFCGDPLKYILITNLTEEYNFKNIFVEPIKSALKEDMFSTKSQGLLKNGYQTAGNIFAKYFCI